MSLTDLDLLARHVEEPVDLFRIVKGATRGAPGVLDLLRSNYERDAPPRGVERQSALIHFGLSMFVSFEAAADRAPRRRARSARRAYPPRARQRVPHRRDRRAGSPDGMGSAAAVAGLHRRYPSSRSTVMNYSLFSSTGNLIDSFTDETEARAALQRIVEAEPDAAEDVALFVADDAGGRRPPDPRRAGSRALSAPGRCSSPPPAALAAVIACQERVPRGREVVRRAIQASMSSRR